MLKYRGGLGGMQEWGSGEDVPGQMKVKEVIAYLQECDGEEEFKMLTKLYVRNEVGEYGDYWFEVGVENESDLCNEQCRKDGTPKFEVVMNAETVYSSEDKPYLAGYKIGQEVYATLIAPHINGSEGFTIVFPECVNNVSLSFINGVFDLIILTFGRSYAVNSVEVLGNDRVVAKVKKCLA